MLQETRTIKVKDLADHFQLRCFYKGEDFDRKVIKNPDYIRPGLQLAASYNYFVSDRIQILGHAEMAYLTEFPEDIAAQRVEALFAKGIPVLILANGTQPFPWMEDLAHQYNIPLLGTEERTSRFATSLAVYIAEKTSPEERRHANLVDIYGIGVLIEGGSGIGKSETSLELIRRGHRLVADDVTVVKQSGMDRLRGESSETAKNFMVIRGIGMINIAALYGLSATSDAHDIDMLVVLISEKEARQAMDEKDKANSSSIHQIHSVSDPEPHYTTILGIQVPTYTIVVAPGKNIPILIETAALNMRYLQTNRSPLLDYLDAMKAKAAARALEQGETEENKNGPLNNLLQIKAEGLEKLGEKLEKSCYEKSQESPEESPQESPQE